MAKQINTAPSKKKKGDDEFYDYDAAKKAGITGPDASGHWPSDFKKEGHPNLVVGGYNTKTGKRVPGTKQGTEAELLASGWDAESSKRLGRVDVAKKPAYDVSKRFQEVAKRAKETGPIHTGPSKKLEPSKPQVHTGPAKRPKQGVLGKYKEDQIAFDTRPGRTKGEDDNPKQKPDVTLPISSASSDVKDRMAKLRAMRK